MRVFWLACAGVAVSFLLAEAVLADQSPALRSGARSSPQAVVEALINPKPIALPVVNVDDLSFVHLSTAQGLSQTRVQQIVQDDAGFIWFGTQFGLNRYDGYKFKVFAHDSSRIGSLGGMYIYSLFRDRSGYLWIGTEQTLDRFDPRTEVFTHYALKSRNPNAGTVVVYHINQDHDGILWLSTGMGLFRLDPATGNASQFQHDPTDSMSLSNSDVKSTLEDSRHRFWVANSSGLDEFDPLTGKVRLHVPIRQPVREFLVHEDATGVLWLAYASGGGAGLSTYDPISNVRSDYAFASKDVPGGVFTGVYAIEEDHEGTMWLGTGGMGLLKLDRARQRFLRYKYGPNDPESISDDHVTALLADGDGNMWVGLNSTGPNFFATRPPLFRNVMRNFQSQRGGEALVSSVFQDRRGMLWIGSANGLSQFDPQTGAPVASRATERGAKAGIVVMTEDSIGDLWLGTVGQGLKRLDPRTGHIWTYKHDGSNPSSLSNDAVLGLVFEGRDKLWVSTWDGVDLFDITTRTFTPFKVDTNRGTERYTKFVVDEHGVLWLGSDSGLVRLDPRNSSSVIFRHTDDPGAISNDDVNSVFMDSERQLWLATQNGLNRFNADGTFSTYLQREGPGGNAISCILEDSAGYLWLSTNKGVSRFDRRSKDFLSFSTADGVGDLTGWDTCLKSSSGEMYFGGFSGLIAFDPHKVADVPTHAPLRLIELKLQGQPAEIGPNSPLKQSIVYASGLTLPSDLRSVSLEFASLNFLESGATRYRYKMDGLEDRWEEGNSDQRVVSYTSLPSGDYIFHAQAAVGRGTWNEPGVTLRIRVLPPWWKSWWFSVMAAAFVFVLVWSAYQYRLRGIARQFDMRLEERVNERTRIARELHDSLLQGFQGLMFRLQAVLDLIPDRPAEAVEELESALNLADKAVVEGREAVSNLRGATIVETDLETLLAALADEPNLGSGERGPSYQVIVQGKARALSPIVRDDVYRIAREAFRNAVRHSQASKIEAELEFGDTQFQLRLRDNGIGIGHDVLRQRAQAGHWGVQGMRERADALGGHLDVWSEHGAGTEVALSIPAAIAYGQSLT